MLNRNTSTALACAIAMLMSTQSFAEVPNYTRTTIDSNLTGAAFVIGGNVVDNGYLEIVASTFGQMTMGPQGPMFPPAGKVVIYRSKRNLLGQITGWERADVVGLADSIKMPNRPTLADINRDGKQDLIVPGGYFFDTFIGNSLGTLTWWENKGFGNRWVRHNIVTGSRFSYHSAVYADFDGNGTKDIMTVGEQAGDPQNPADDVVELQLFRGNTNGTFQSAVKVADGGGGLIEAYDVNRDGRMDIVSPQFFGPVSGQPMVPAAARDASVASFVWFENKGNGVFTRHAIGTNQGTGFSIVPVRNLRGDNVVRWIATNHTNKNVAFPPYSLYPEPAVYEFTPGSDPRQPWAVRQLSAPGSFPVTGGVGQAAPGAAAAAHLNADGRLDIAVSGDGSRAVYWLEQRADGTFATHQLPNSTGYGQSGGPVVLDFNLDYRNEIVFGSFDQNAMSIWSR